MTVKELIEKLGEANQDAEVFVDTLVDNNPRDLEFVWIDASRIILSFDG